SDIVARLAQLPFYVLSAIAGYAIARRMGAASTPALVAPTLILLAPVAVEQAAGANVDLISAAMFLTSIYLGVVAVDRDERRDWVMWGLAVGLFLGTKYLSLVYL